LLEIILISRIKPVEIRTVASYLMGTLKCKDVQERRWKAFFKSTGKNYGSILIADCKTAAM